MTLHGGHRLGQLLQHLRLGCAAEESHFSDTQVTQGLTTTPIRRKMP